MSQALSKQIALEIDDAFQKSLKQKKKLTQMDTDTILSCVINRQRFTYSISDMMVSIVEAAFFCCKTSRRTKKKNMYFGKAKKKLEKDLDIISLLKNQRKLGLVTNAVLDSR